MANIIWKDKATIDAEKEQSKVFERENFYKSERERGAILLTEHTLGMEYVSDDDVIEIKEYLQFLNPKTSQAEYVHRPKVMDEIYPIDAR